MISILFAKKHDTGVELCLILINLQAPNPLPWQPNQCLPSSLFLESTNSGIKLTLVAANSSRLCFVSSVEIALFLPPGSRKGRTGERGVTPVPPPGGGKPHGTEVRPRRRWGGAAGLQGGRRERGRPPSGRSNGCAAAGEERGPRQRQGGMAAPTPGRREVRAEGECAEKAPRGVADPAGGVKKWVVSPSVDVVPTCRNHFYIFSPLSSLKHVPHHQNAELSS
jgi:hypothetical protein